MVAVNSVNGTVQLQAQEQQVYRCECSRKRFSLLLHAFDIQLGYLLVCMSLGL